MLRCEKIYRSGGILADDMGLGKSFQTLATIVNNPLSEDSMGTTLIVVPLSLIGQWKQEVAEKLTIPLRVGVYHGPERKNLVFSDYDIVLTTYACLSKEYDEVEAVEKERQRDIQFQAAMLRYQPYNVPPLVGAAKGKKERPPKSQPDPLMSFEWYRIVLDECQNIKNGSCQTALAAHQLKGKFRWCLSGTPIQNRTSEFMSLYRFVKGHSTNSVSRAMEDLDHLILRRTKEEVLKLPERKVIQQEVVMKENEKTIYENYEDISKEKVYDMMNGGRGMMKEMANILVEMLRLRQMSDHPKLAMEGECSIRYSSKQQKIMRIIRDARATNEKIVVFSSFVEMLRLIEEGMKGLSWDYALFYGGMNSKQREAALKKFKTADSCNVLLMSTKAGNVGLNLTVATKVIITEPWWNPFIDEQAMDRVHRIGQTRKVAIHQMVVKGTIEERIVALQQKKRCMFESVFGGRSTKGCARLSREDIQFLFRLDEPF